MLKLRRKQAAKAHPRPYGYMIHFRIGGWYRLAGGKLLTGATARPASDLQVAKLMPLALRAVELPGEWVE